MTGCQLDPQLIQNVREIRSQSDYTQFSKLICGCRIADDCIPSLIAAEWNELNNIAQAETFLLPIATKANARPLPSWQLNAALIEDGDPLCVYAAAFYVIHDLSALGEYLKEVFFADDPYIEVRASRESRYVMPFMMGLSGKIECEEPLLKMLIQHYHWYNQQLVAQALERVGSKEVNGIWARQCEKAVEPFSISIAAYPASTRRQVIIGTDKRFTGASNCPQCQFFPCIINRYFSGAIEDCKLWNRAGPIAVDEIVDQRCWGITDIDAGDCANGEGGYDVEANPDRQAVSFSSAKEHFDRGKWWDAVEKFAETIVAIDKYEGKVEASVHLAAWLYMARCFAALELDALCLIARCEARRLGKLIAISEEDLQRDLLHVDEERQRYLRAEGEKRGVPWTCDGESEAGVSQGRDLSHKCQMRALQLKKRGRWAEAMRCYETAWISSDGAYAGSWFEIGECALALGHYRLAEVLCVQAAIRTPEKNLQRKFEEVARKACAEAERKEGKTGASR